MKIPATVYIRKNVEIPLPQWGLKWLTPELHKADPLHKKSLSIGEFRDPSEGETMLGYVLYEYLNQTGLLARCLNLLDGVSLIRHSNILRPPYFTGTRILLWKSAIQGRCKNVFVPFVQIISGQLPIIYYWWVEYPIHLKMHKGLLRK